MKSPHCYSSLPLSWIRLLCFLTDRDQQAEIRCQLVDYDLSNGGDGRQAYEALSYVWGTAEHKQRILVGESRYIDVTTNLFSVLRRLRYCSLERLIWIDVICINQDDLRERTPVLLSGSRRLPFLPATK